MVRNVLLRGTGEHRQNGVENVGSVQVGSPPGRGLTEYEGERGGGGAEGPVGGRDKQAMGVL